MKGIIYKYTSPSKKCYIGQTLNEKKRKYTFNNINQSYGSAKINNARKKYSPNNFLYEILFEYESENKNEVVEMLGKMEIFYIDKYDSMNNGYNYQSGGKNKTNIISKESRRSAALKVSKSILQYSIDGKFIREWESTMEIERNLNIDHTLISQNCLGKTKHCREFIFKHKISEEFEKEINVVNVKIHKTKRLSITQYDASGIKVKTWNTISEAARDLKIDRKTLRKLADSGKTFNDFTYIINNK